jgi:hypothetical protein
MYVHTYVCICITSSEFFSYAPFLYVESMQCQTDLIGLYYMSSMNNQNNMPMYKKLVSNTVDQNTGNSKFQIVFSRDMAIL